MELMYAGPGAAPDWRAGVRQSKRTARITLGYAASTIRLAGADCSLSRSRQGITDPGPTYKEEHL